VGAISLKSSFGKFVGADLKILRVVKELSQKSVGGRAPTLTRPLPTIENGRRKVGEQTEEGQTNVEVEIVI